jgi:predicted RNA-binding Zn-ribbon protein involved in translation (DUF1610 family)
MQQTLKNMQDPYTNKCDSCGWEVARNMHAVAHEGFRFYCNRCHGKIVKEARKAFKEKQQRLEGEQEKKDG